MRIITYNILDGGEERISLIAQILRDQNPDMIALQETNDRRNAEKLACGLNMQLIFGEANSAYHVARSPDHYDTPLKYAINTEEE